MLDRLWECCLVRLAAAVLLLSLMEIVALRLLTTLVGLACLVRDVDCLDSTLVAAAEAFCGDFTTVLDTAFDGDCVFNLEFALVERILIWLATVIFWAGERPRGVYRVVFTLDLDCLVVVFEVAGCFLDTLAIYGAGFVCFTTFFDDDEALVPDELRVIRVTVDIFIIFV